MSLPFSIHETKKNINDSSTASTTSTTTTMTAATQRCNNNSSIFLRRSNSNNGKKTNDNNDYKAKKVITNPSSPLITNTLAEILPKQRKKRLILCLLFLSTIFFFYTFRYRNGGAYQAKALETRTSKQQENGIMKGEESDNGRDADNEKKVQSSTFSTLVNSEKKYDEKGGGDTTTMKTTKTKHSHHYQPKPSYSDVDADVVAITTKNKNGIEKADSNGMKLPQQDGKNVAESTSLSNSATVASDQKSSYTPTAVGLRLLEATPYIMISICSILIDFTLCIYPASSSSYTAKILILSTRIITQVLLFLSNTITLFFSGEKWMIMATSSYLTIGLVLLSISCEVAFKTLLSNYNNHENTKKQDMYDERNKVIFNSMASTSYTMPLQSSSAFYPSSPIISTTRRINYVSTGKSVLSYMRLGRLSSLCLPFYILSVSSSSLLKDEMLIGCIIVFLVTFVSLAILRIVFKRIHQDRREKHVHFNLSGEDENVYDEQRGWKYNNGIAMVEAGEYNDVGETIGNYDHNDEENDDCFATGDYYNDNEQQRRRQKKRHQHDFNTSSSSYSSPLQGWEDLLKNNSSSNKDITNDFKSKEEELLHHKNQIAMKQMKDLLQEKFGGKMSLATFDTIDEDNGPNLENEVEGTKQRFKSLPPEIQVIASRRPDLVQMFADAANKEEESTASFPDDGGGKIGACRNDQKYDNNNDALLSTQATNQNTAQMPSSGMMAPETTGAATDMHDSVANTSNPLHHVPGAEDDENNSMNDITPSKLAASSTTTSAISSSSSSANSLIESMPPHIREIALRRPDLLSQILSTKNIKL